MKNWFAMIALSLGLFLVWSCDNELELIDEWRDIPVVYALLSQSDTVHYIRVEKAFLDPTTSAFEIAQRPDSLYYGASVSVEIEEAATGNRVRLERIDGNTVGLQREEGVFADSPNILYRFFDDQMPLKTNEAYRLIVTDGDTDQVLTEATTNMVGAFELLASQPRNPMNLRPGTSLSVGWRHEDEISEGDQTAVFFDLRMLLHYSEQVGDDPTNFEDKVLEWVIERAIERPVTPSTGNFSPQISTSVSGIAFFEFLAANIQSNSPRRVFKTIDVVIDGAAQEVFDYINIGQANTGITSAQAIPTYTNLSQGIGIFSSRDRYIFEEFNLAGEARDSLRESSITQHLNFQ